MCLDQGSVSRKRTACAADVMPSGPKKQRMSFFEQDEMMRLAPLQPEVYHPPITGGYNRRQQDEVAQLQAWASMMES